MTLPDFSVARLLVMGDVMIDHYWHGSVDRISPEAPVPVVHVKKDESRIGGAGNVALNAVSLGAQTQLIGLTGDDAIANEITATLNKESVHCYLQRVPGCASISKQRIIARNQQLLRLDFDNGFHGADEEALERQFESRLSTVDVVILSDYAKGTLGNPSKLINASLQANKFVIVDPKSKDFSRYSNANLLTPNLAEFEAAVGHCDNEEAIERRGHSLIEKLNLSALLITRSADGMTLLARGLPTLHLAAQVQEVYDVTGAGDTVAAALGVSLAAGLPLQEAARLANTAAGIVVTKFGTATVSRRDLENALQPSSYSYTHQILDEHLILERVNAEKAQGKVIVMTNGCFDLLHPGHVACLEKARSLGDRLIVAINDDASVQRLKGQTRPINDLASRIRMLAALKCVDWVVPFSTDTPEHLYRLFQPNILVKGGDYTESQIIGAETVMASGGKIHIVDHLPGHSTSDLIRRIQGLSS